jgi:hypothetical protein
MAQAKPDAVTRIVKWAAIGGAVGILVSIIGHHSPGMLRASTPLGAIVALIVGFAYGRNAEGGYPKAAGGGALVGALAANLGILVGLLYGDQSLAALLGIVGGGIAGGVGAAIAQALAR